MVKPEYLASLITFVGMGLVLGFLCWRAATGKSVAKIRPLAALTGLEEVMGQAAEKGRPVVVVIGGRIARQEQAAQVMVALAVLRYVCRLAGRFKVKVLSPTACGEMIPLLDTNMKEGYQEGGSPDLYKVNRDIMYLGDTATWTFTFAVMGLIARVKAAATVLLGWVMSGSIVYTEAGSMVGAVQVGGSADFGTLPTLVLGCDYTLISEEMYAAGAYLSQNPVEIATILGQDVVKLILIAILVVGFVASSVGLPQLANILVR